MTTTTTAAAAADDLLDPRLVELLADSDVPDAEQRLVDALTSAMRRFLQYARDAVLNGKTPPRPDSIDEPDLTAAAGDEPDLDQWPDPQLWQRLVENAVLPTATAVFDAAFRHHAQAADIASERYRQQWIERVRDRLSRNLWSDGVFEEVRYELAEATTNGESIDQIRDRLGTVLRIDAPSREIRAQINEHKRKHERVPPELYDAERAGHGVWHNAARRIARTETLGAYNSGSFNAGRALQDATGEPRYKVWIATSDSRTRDAHRRADKQAVPLDDKFDVDGEALDYPGDPNGSASNVIQCRCTTIVVKADEAERYNKRREAELPNRTDYRGEPVAAAAAGNQALDQLYAAREEQEHQQTMNTPSTWADRVVASIPAEPPADWFTNPQLTGPTKIRVTDQGRVYGHIAPWGEPHASMPEVTAPRDPYGGQYPRFHRHPVRTADGTRINTGPLATGGHADIAASLGEVVQHYDDPTYVVADVRAGEDEHGIWVSGALRPDASPFQVMMLDRYSISGDWRGGELVAACSVSVPGFHLDHDDQVVALAASATHRRGKLADPTPRVHHDADGHPVALVAAGIIDPDRVEQADMQRKADAEAWARLRAERRVAKAVDDIQAAAKRIHNPVLSALDKRIHNTEGNTHG